MPLPIIRNSGDTPAQRVLLEALGRYAGWLNRERQSRLVRTDVESLARAIETKSDPGPHLDSLEANLDRLPAGEVRTMLRKILAQLRHGFEDGTLNQPKGS